MESRGRAVGRVSTLVALLALVGPGCSERTPAGPTDAGGLELVHLLGRFDLSTPGEPQLEWSGTGAVAKFTGTGVAVRLRGSPNQFAVVVDQGAPTVLRFDGTTATISLAAGLPAGTHRIELHRRTEAFFGPVWFGGFSVTEGTLVPSPAPFTHRLELVGDSITCGYGDEGAGPRCRFSADTENEYLAWGAVAARQTGAEHRAIAWSGKGLYRNNDGTTDELMPVLYQRTIPTEATSQWNFSSWTPEVVVVNLGTNDFVPGDPGQPFVDAYVAFAASLRARYPQAWIFCALGPMENGAAARTAVQAVVAARTQAGDARVRFLELATQTGELGYGCDYHPSVATQQQMADALVAQLRAVAGW
jgi:lysophospholipase L1-like esterase